MAWLKKATSNLKEKEFRNIYRFSGLYMNNNNSTTIWQICVGILHFTVLYMVIIYHVAKSLSHSSDTETPSLFLILLYFFVGFAKVRRIKNVFFLEMLHIFCRRYIPFYLAYKVFQLRQSYKSLLYMQIPFKTLPKRSLWILYIL